MIKLYTVTKNKTGIVGLWQDNKKIYRDNIKIKYCKNYRKLNLGIQKLFNNGEKAVFYVCNDIAYIEENKGRLIPLINRIAWEQKYLNASIIKHYLNEHKGLTIYRNKKSFTIEIWKK